MCPHPRRRRSTFAGGGRRRLFCIILRQLIDYGPRSPAPSPLCGPPPSPPSSHSPQKTMMVKLFLLFLFLLQPTSTLVHFPSTAAASTASAAQSALTRNAFTRLDSVSPTAARAAAMMMTAGVKVAELVGSMMIELQVGRKILLRLANVNAAWQQNIAEFSASE